MILYRTLAHDREARSTEAGGPLWFPRRRQGGGRHDNPEQYGCLYASEDERSGVAEVLSRFLGETALAPWMFSREGRPLALATIELADDAELVDLDRPSVLTRERLRPSLVATRERELTQPQALAIYDRHPRAVGLRWWSTLESLWANVTLFDRAAPSMSVVDVRELSLTDPAVTEAAELLGLAPA